ncbi:hypothetical protein HAX54_023724 [Datura stramonium]|uniref:Uncharacterized protein n=1 Tax=Datura stramonium TaxID=4076 RepID=A0ABS8UYT0_DATST|nr:hypothetical protein [Datura stramonium]
MCHNGLLRTESAYPVHARDTNVPCWVKARQASCHAKGSPQEIPYQVSFRVHGVYGLKEQKWQNGIEGTSIEKLASHRHTCATACARNRKKWHYRNATRRHIVKMSRTTWRHLGAMSGVRHGAFWAAKSQIPILLGIEVENPIQCQKGTMQAYSTTIYTPS